METHTDRLERQTALDQSNEAKSTKAQSTSALIMGSSVKVVLDSEGENTTLCTEQHGPRACPCIDAMLWISMAMWCTMKEELYFKQGSFKLLERLGMSLWGNGLRDFFENE